MFGRAPPTKMEVISIYRNTNLNKMFGKSKAVTEYENKMDMKQ